MKYPETKKEETQDNIFGKSIEDPYRWLEDFTSEEAADWVKEQNELTDSFTSNKYQKNIKKELESIWITQDISIPFRRGNKTFYYFDDGRKQQAVFMVKACNDCEPKVLLDPNKFSTDGTISLSDISVSPNGDYLAYSVSDGGSDWRTWKVYNIETAQETDDLIEWSKFSYAVWESDSSGFYYQKYKKPDEFLSDINRSPQLYFHKLGDKQLRDSLVYEDKLHPDRSWSISVPEKGNYRVLSIGEGTDERNFLSISLDESLNFIPVIDEFKATYRFLGGDENTLWFFSNLNAPNGKILSLKISNEDFEWTELINEKTYPISSASVVGDNLRLVIIRPANPQKHIFKFGDKNYVIGVTYRDKIDSNGDAVATWDFAMVFDDKQRVIIDKDANGDAGSGESDIRKWVIENDLFENEINSTVDRIVKGAPLVNRTAKKFLNRLEDSTPLSKEEIAEGYALCDTNDYAEGVRAFLAKEKPIFPPPTIRIFFAIFSS